MIHFSTTSLILHYTDVEAYYKDIIFFDVSVYLTRSNQTVGWRHSDRKATLFQTSEVTKAPVGLKSCHCIATMITGSRLLPFLLFCNWRSKNESQLLKGYASEFNLHSHFAKSGSHRSLSKGKLKKNVFLIWGILITHIWVLTSLWLKSKGILWAIWRWLSKLPLALKLPSN